ncbi:MAG: hypothetical protein MUE97_01215 [Phycisphaerales bacterium]|jgi:hypothetical protein|nr:hypothetical protein [Phycisphaerales bacterium]
MADGVKNHDDAGGLGGAGAGAGGGAHGGGEGGEGLAQRLIGEIDALRGELRKAQGAIQRAEQRQRLERAAIDASARDVLAAADALEQRIASGGGTVDVSQAVRELKRERPGLFGASRSAGAQEGTGGEGSENLEVLRERARSGDRASLLLYLQARRGGGGRE